MNNNFNNIKEAVLVVSTDLKIKLATPSSETLFKYTNGELLGKKLTQLLEAPDTLNALATTTSAADTLDTHILDSQNNKIPVSIYVKKVNDNSNRPLGFIFILKNILEKQTNNKILEEKIQELKQKNDSLKNLQQQLQITQTSIDEKTRQKIDEFKKAHAILLSSIYNLGLCFLITDQYSNITFSNQAAQNIFPPLSKEKNMTITELQNITKMSVDLNSQVKKSCLENKNISISDVQINSNSFNILISPIFLKSKQASATIGTSIIIKDETEEHNLQRSKEDFFNIAAHELRTPLTSIYGYTALIKQLYFMNIQNEELKLTINKIGILSKKLSLSVSNFLDSSKLEQGKIELNNDQCNLFTLINNSLKEMEIIALEKNLYIKFDAPSSPIIITVDQTRFTQILNIMISNAIKYTRSGGIYISVENKSKFIKIIIQDTGIGISEENKKLLFHKFQQTGENLLTRQEGTGLGLHIAKLLIEKMGGKIMLEKTEINQGSTFSFTIPINNT